MILEDLRTWVSLGASILALGTAAWALLQGPSKRNEGAIGDLKRDVSTTTKDLEKSIALVEDKADAAVARLGQLETIIHQLPDKDSMHRLEISLEKVNGQLNTLSERLNPIDNLSRRLQEVLLEKSK